MALEWREGTICRKTVWGEGLFTVAVSVEGIEPFEPGQFLHVGLEATVDGTTKIIHRPYSVASPWGETVEFFIVVVPEGELTPRLWERGEGDRLVISRRASGRFSLAHTPRAENLWLMATGTGLAPYIAMLRDPAVWQHYQRIVVVHGVRMGADLAYTAEMQNWEKLYPGRFRSLSALTRERVDGQLHGRLPALLASGELEAAAGCCLRPETSAVMLCGNPAMLDDMEQELGQRGIQRHRSKAPGQLVLERYW